MANIIESAETSEAVDVFSIVSRFSYKGPGQTLVWPELVYTLLAEGQQEVCV